MLLSTLRAARSGSAAPRDAGLIVGSSQELVRSLGPQVEVRTGFISEEEEKALLKELEPGLRKKRYEFDHWDDVSHILIIHWSFSQKCITKE